MSAEVKGAPIHAKGVFGPTKGRVLSGMIPKCVHHVFSSEGKLSWTAGEWRKRAMVDREESRCAGVDVLPHEQRTRS